MIPDDYFENEIYEYLLKSLVPKETASSRDGKYREIRSPLKARQIRFQLEAFGLIRAEVELRERPSYLSFNSLRTSRDKLNVTVWRITEKGRRFMAELWALKTNKDFVSS